MEKKIMVCPVCGKKVGFFKLIGESTFKCSKCKNIVEMKVTNSIEREKIEKMMKYVSPLIWVLLGTSVLGIMANYMDSVLNNYIVPMFIAQWIVLIGVYLTFFFMAKKKRELYVSKDLKLVVRNK